jgi:hypothetical protein
LERLLSSGENGGAEAPTFQIGIATMPRRCSICDSVKVDEINWMLVEGRTAYRRIASLCDVSEAAVRRHAARHLPAVLAEAIEAERAADGDDLLKQLQNLQGRAVAILERAEREGDHRVALGAIREARGCLELLGRLAGELQERQSVNVLVNPQWVEIRCAIIQALEPHVEARDAVTQALESVSGDGC